MLVVFWQGLQRKVLATQPGPEVCRYLMERAADAEAAGAYLDALRFPLGLAVLDSAPLETRIAYVHPRISDVNL